MEQCIGNFIYMYTLLVYHLIILFLMQGTSNTSKENVEAEPRVRKKIRFLSNE
jgi:hypothetical protein